MKKIVFIFSFLTLFSQICYAVLHITNVSPTDRQMNVSRTCVIYLYFDQVISNSTVNASSIFLLDSDKNFVPVSYTVTGNEISLTPAFELAPNEFYIVTITTNLKSAINDNLASKTNTYFYTTVGPPTPHNVSGINWTNDTGWETNDYISYDYKYREVTICEPENTSPSWGAITNFWISWTTNDTFYRIKTLPGTGIPYYTLFLIDTTRDDNGADSFTTPDGSIIYFSNYRKPEIIYLQTNAGGSYWRSETWTIYNWDGNSWQDIGNSGCAFKNIRDYDSDTGLSVKIPNLYFTNGSLTGSMPNRISVLAMNIQNGEYTISPTSGKWVTYDIDNDGNDISDGSPLPPPPPLAVISTDPYDGETEVALNKVITVTFNSNINSSTVNDTNFIVYDSNNSKVPGSLSVSGKTITFTSSNSFKVLEKYTVIIGTTIESTSGTSLAAPYIFNFTTIYNGPFYVHLSLGNDSTSQGTKTSPFKTVQKALTKMNFNTINTCYIEGVFTNQLELSNTYGTSSNPIVLTKWSNDWKISNASYGITFSVKNVQNIVLKHLIIDSPVNYGIHIQKKISNISIVSSTIKGSSDRGVFFNTGSDNSDNIRFIATALQEFNYPLITSVPLGELSIEDSVIKNSGNYCMYLGGNVNKLIIRNSEIKSNQYGLLVPTSGHTIQDLIITNSLIINNGTYGVLSQGTVNGGAIKSCYFSNHTQEGIYQSATLNNFLIRSNIMVDNGQYTLYFSKTSNLKIIKNKIKGSSSSATYFGDSTQNLIFQSNILVNNGSYGFYSAKTGSFGDAFKRNLIVGNTSYAILMGQNFTSFTMRNNTIDVSGNYGASLRSSGTINFRNNILIKSGGTGSIGLIVGAGTITNAYNDIYNFTTLYSGTTPGAGALSTDPIFVDTLPSNWFSSNYYYLDVNSPCIDAGDPSDTVPPNGGTRIDMGWKEYKFLLTSLYITKYITNITIGNINSVPIPGSTIEYYIMYSNTGSYDAQNAIIYDKIPAGCIYKTNGGGTATGWTIEFSTNISPDQSWNSADYTNMLPNDKTKIKWIRWIKSSVSPNEDGLTLKYTIIIK